MSRGIIRSGKQNFAPYYNSSGYKKLIAYYKEITKKEFFRNKIQELRGNLDVPKDGFVNNQKVSGYPPEQWIHKTDKEKMRFLDSELKKLSLKYELPPNEWLGLIKHYFFFDSVAYPVEENAYNLCLISDLAKEKIEPFDDETQMSDNKYYPIAIRLSPYASLRDILDFVRRTYKTGIMPLQNKYKKAGVRLGKIKEKDRSTERRNDFIHKHRDLPRKEIQALVSKEFNQYLDYAEISKIISLQKERRKEA